MKSISKSFLKAFSNYSLGPKGSSQRCKENSGWICVFLPIIGLIIGICINRWGIAYPYLCNYSVFPAVVASILPTIISGGSHLDGFFRTVDALCSHKPKEDKLRILSEDAHGGYHAIIVCICYFLISIGIWSEMPIDGYFIVAFMYIISRSLFGISVLTFKHATTGKADCYVPEKKGERYLQVVILLAYIIVCGALMLMINKGVGLACLCGAAITFVYYYILASKVFGGIMEEIGGFFVTLCEVIVPIAAVFMYKKWF